jgi:hypothetical protein
MGDGMGWQMTRESSFELLRPEDLDIPVVLPVELQRLASQRLVLLTPWEIMGRDLARKRLAGLRSRYRRPYVPFARRQDNDDLACILPDEPGVIIVHDFSAEGHERVTSYGSFWDWFRAAVEDMIGFDP